jgi:hypothetical protein
MTSTRRKNTDLFSKMIPTSKFYVRVNNLNDIDYDIHKGCDEYSAWDEDSEEDEDDSDWEENQTELDSDDDGYDETHYPIEELATVDDQTELDSDDDGYDETHHNMIENLGIDMEVDTTILDKIFKKEMYE